VSVSYLHLPVHQAIAVALVIASVKGSLVACYFMHLISEKKLILYVMLLTVAFFAVLLLVPVFTVSDRIGS
jgi:cytochrome c oxidase subunit 4